MPLREINKQMLTLGLRGNHWFGFGELSIVSRCLSVAARLGSPLAGILHGCWFPSAIDLNRTCSYL
jgi:hypothetical protein